MLPSHFATTLLQLVPMSDPDEGGKGAKALRDTALDVEGAAGTRTLRDSLDSRDKDILGDEEYEGEESEGESEGEEEYEEEEPAMQGQQGKDSSSA